LTPTGWVDADNEIHWNTELTVFVEPRAEGNDLAVYLRSIEADFECLSAEAIPLLVIPFDAAFGNHRVVLHLKTLTVSELTRERLTSEP